jgi:hypothetical protein
MKVGDLVYPYLHAKQRKTIGIIVETYNNKCSVFAVLIEGLIYNIPRFQLVLALQEVQAR